MSEGKLKGAVVGCRGMGSWHARSMARSQAIDLVGVCDLDEALAAKLAAELPGARAYGDMEVMLEAEAPDVLTLATPSACHAALTIRAARAGVRGICCEKPMAVDLGEARAMAAACREAGVPLIINHQRRTLPSMVRMRQLIVEGAIGEVQLLRGSCQGDLLSDGTHLIDSLLHLAGDAEVEWVFGAVYRDPPSPDEPRGEGYTASGGYRYGHPIETGAVGIWQFADGPRAEIFTGGLRVPGRKYNDYEILGSRGRLWRSGDREHPGVYLQRAADGAWQPIEGDFGSPETVLTKNYDRFAAIVRAGEGDHPLWVGRALRGFEVLMGIFESARLRRKVTPPLEQERYPLALMIESGEV
jgi:predicted dehydrogenase